MSKFNEIIKSLNKLFKDKFIVISFTIIGVLTMFLLPWVIIILLIVKVL